MMSPRGARVIGLALWTVWASLAFGQPLGREPIQPLAPAKPRDARAMLGGLAFVDPRLSGDGKRACVSCHDVSASGASRVRFDKDPTERALPFNTPTVFNASLNFRLNWSGSARGLQQQARATLANPRVMASSAEAAAARLRADPAVNARFRQVFGRDADADALVSALVAYELTLTTPGARFDRWLWGDAAALTPIERRGYDLFKAAGCSSCHQGRNVGGNLMQKSGVFHPVTDTAPTAPVMRVPSLRNVALTAPYFHDGSAATLEDAIQTMGKAQLDRRLSLRETAELAAFLRTLTARASARADTVPADPGPMKRQIALAFVLVLLLCATVFLTSRPAKQGETFSAAERALLAYDAAQAKLRQDAISVRSGMLQSFDPLVEDIDRLEAALRPLRQDPRLLRATRSLIDRLEAQGRRQAALTEQLKSDSALVRNSLAYFSEIGAHQERLGPASPEMGALSAAMLRLTSDTTGSSIATATERIEALEHVASRDTSGRASVALSHARLLLQLLPQTDACVLEILSTREAATRDALRARIERERAQAEMGALYHRVLLCGVVVVLLLALVELALRLSRHLHRLRRRIAFEHAAAAISASLVHAQPHELDDTIRSALADLSGLLSATHARLVGEGVYQIEQSWGEDLNCRVHGTELLDVVERDALGPLDFQSGVTERLGRRDGFLAVMAKSEDSDRVAFIFLRRGAPLTLEATDRTVLRTTLDVLAGAVRRVWGELRRTRLEAQLRQAARMETVGVFASGIAHNFNNLLGAIRGHAEMSLDKTGTTPELAAHQEDILATVLRAAALVDQILDYGARRPCRHGDVLLSGLVEEALSLLVATSPRADIVEFTPPPEALIVAGRHGDLLQIVLNLVSNALQAATSRVRVELAPEEVRQPVDLSDGVVEVGDYIALRVIDDGPGVAPAIRRRIFAPFFTTKPQGTGLGLATVSRTAREHGGGVCVEDGVEGGAIFTVLLPVASSIAPGLPGQGEILLVVAMGSRKLDLDEEVVAELGYEPLALDSAEDAERALISAPTRFDGAIVAAPDHQAVLSAAERLRAIRDDLPLVLAADPPLQAQALAERLGRAAACAWPPTAEGLTVAIRAALKRGAPSPTP